MSTGFRWLIPARIRLLMQTFQCMSMTILSLLFSVLLFSPVHGETRTSNAECAVVPSGNRASTSLCEDFAQRQVSLADRLSQKANYTRALKVLNSTIENCDQEFVREKLFEVFNQWFDTVSTQGSPSALRQFKNALSRQAHLTSAQEARLDRQIQSQVRSLIASEYRGEDFDAAYQLCRAYPSYTDENFETKYYCGVSAEEVGASGVAMNSYAWLIQNWQSNQSVANWKETADKLERLYLLNGRFAEAHRLTRRLVVRDPSPSGILSSLISLRGSFLSPLMRVGATFYENQPSESALSHVHEEMQRVNFPKYVNAFYVLASDGTVQRGMYGSEANEPSSTLLEEATGRVSLLRAQNSSNLSWLVSPIGSRFLILEFGTATTEEESVRLENIHQNVDSEEQWKKLHDLEFRETSPASGSAIGTLLSGALMSGQGFNTYDAIFDDSPILSYYCIQNDSDGIEESYNFNRSNLGYGEDEWKRTSSTPALYHHSITYGGHPVREVVWPKFVDDQWAGVIRVGLAQS